MQWFYGNGSYAYLTKDGSHVWTETLAEQCPVTGNEAFRALEAKEALITAIELWLVNSTNRRAFSLDTRDRMKMRPSLY